MRLEHECANYANHTWMPDGYFSRNNWVYRAMKKHKQAQCPACKLWAIWVPNRPGIDPLPTVREVEEAIKDVP